MPREFSQIISSSSVSGSKCPFRFPVQGLVYAWDRQSWRQFPCARNRAAENAPHGSAALRHATVVLPSERELDELLARVGADEPLVRDPSGNALLLTA